MFFLYTVFGAAQVCQFFSDPEHSLRDECAKYLLEQQRWTFEKRVLSVVRTDGIEGSTDKARDSWVLQW